MMAFEKVPNPSYQRIRLGSPDLPNLIVNSH
jgi:hypothetical protein